MGHRATGINLRIYVLWNFVGVAADQLLFEGKWCHPIRSSESFWVLEQKTFLLLTLEKKRELWWDCLIQGDTSIDTTKVGFPAHPAVVLSPLLRRLVHFRSLTLAFSSCLRFSGRVC